MNYWITFLLGFGTGGALLLAAGAFVLNVASSTPQMALASIAATLRGFSKKLDSLHLVVLVGGEKVLLPFEQIVTAIENADLATHRCDPEADSQQPTAPDPVPDLAESRKPKAESPPP